MTALPPDLKPRSAMLELDPHHEPELVDHYAAGEGLPIIGPNGAPLPAAGAAAVGPSRRRRRRMGSE